MQSSLTVNICMPSSLGASLQVKSWHVQGCTGSSLGTRVSASTIIRVVRLCMHNSYAVCKTPWLNKKHSRCMASQCGCCTVLTEQGGLSCMHMAATQAS